MPDSTAPHYTLNLRATRKIKYTIGLLGMLPGVAGAIAILCSAIGFDVGLRTPQGFEDHIMFIVIGLAILVFCGMAAWSSLIVLIDKKPALIIDSQGIRINSCVLKGNVNFLTTRQELFAWHDINEIKSAERNKTYNIAIHIANPEQWLAHYKGFTWLMKLQLRAYHTPVIIDAVLLQQSVDTIISTLNESFTYYKKS